MACARASGVALKSYQVFRRRTLMHEILISSEHRYISSSSVHSSQQANGLLNGLLKLSLLKTPVTTW
ncbi:hypothetical protein N7523_010948 [Penicillium sp. IBT 18751x]|nr:hypothetical protein N7523_010948 [Penicillium sp. IBT 18751x]